MKLRVGDVICVNSTGPMGKIVSWFSRGYSEPKTYCNHVAICKRPGVVSEAKLTIKDTTFSEWEEKGKNFEVWRYKNITQENRVKMRNFMEEYHGHLYAAWKLPIFALDLFISKFRKKESYMFRKFFDIDNHPICSWYVGYAYFQIGYRFNGIDPDWIDPDGMHDFVKKSEDWTLIYKK